MSRDYFSLPGYDAWKTRAPEDEPGYWDGRDEDSDVCPECGTDFSAPSDMEQRAELRNLLAEAVKQIETLIDDDPEWAGGKFIDTGCSHCTEGCTPARFDTGLCWRHRAAQVLKEGK